jgi:hypothetical protein
MSEPNENTKFYKSLKNAQPIAFLASFAMVIAAFSFKNNIDATIYGDAVIASVMFLISFMFSLIDQLRITAETGLRLVHWGKFFFLGIVILYLVGVGWGFAKSIPQIGDIFLSWTFILMGSTGLGTLLSSKNKSYPIKFTSDTIFFIVSSLCIFIVGLLYLGRQILEQRIGTEVWSNLVTYLFIGSVISLGLAFFFTIQSQKKNQNIKK